MRVPPERTPSQAKRGPSKKTGQKLTSLPWSLRLQAPWKAVLLVPLTCCSLPACPFPIRSLALSAWVSSPTIRFWVLDKSPLLGPGRGPCSCNNTVVAVAEMGALTECLLYRGRNEQQADGIGGLGYHTQHAQDGEAGKVGTAGLDVCQHSSDTSIFSEK